jgi:hypothetical protein
VKRVGFANLLPAWKRGFSGVNLGESINVALPEDLRTFESGGFDVMKAKQKHKARKTKEPKSSDASVDQLASLLQFFLITTAFDESSGKKLELKNEEQWTIWGVCRSLALEPNHRLAKLFAAPVLGALDAIWDVLLKTEARSLHGNLTATEREQLAAFKTKLILRSRWSAAVLSLSSHFAANEP